MGIEVTEARHTFAELHRGERPLLLPNCWDGVSARMIQAAGARAVGTTSFGMAVAHGFMDGEALPWDTVTALVEAIVEAVDVPVSVDIESGRGRAADIVATTVAQVAKLGVAGINLEDTVPGGEGLLPRSEQCERLAAAREAGGPDLFVNARCDAFFTAQAPPDPVAEVRERAAAYVDAGADGIFVPGLLDLEILEQLAASIDAPINVMVGPGAPPVDDFAVAGVRRLSQGAWAFAATLGHLHRLTADYLAGASYGRPDDAPLAYEHLGDLLYR